MDKSEVFAMNKNQILKLIQIKEILIMNDYLI
jgi:hypothetical protein